MTTQFIAVPNYSDPTLCGLYVSGNEVTHFCIPYQDLVLTCLSAMVAVGIVETARKAFNCCFCRR